MKKVSMHGIDIQVAFEEHQKSRTCISLTDRISQPGSQIG